MLIFIFIGVFIPCLFLSAFIFIFFSSLFSSFTFTYFFCYSTSFLNFSVLHHHIYISLNYYVQTLRYITHTGFFIRTSLIPIYMRWAQYLCAIKYSVNLVLLTEFNLMNKSCQGDAMVNCHALLATNGIVAGNAYIYVLLLFSLFVFFRGLGAIILIQKAKRFY
jgi:hypothetical protein